MAARWRLAGELEGAGSTTSGRQCRISREQGGLIDDRPVEEFAAVVGTRCESLCVVLQLGIFPKGPRSRAEELEVTECVEHARLAIVSRRSDRDWNDDKSAVGGFFRACGGRRRAMP